MRKIHLIFGMITVGKTLGMLLLQGLHNQILLLSLTKKNPKIMKNAVYVKEIINHNNSVINYVKSLKS